MNRAPRDALVLSSVDWDFNWQGQHEISARLAARGGRVVFVENTGSRAPRLTDLGRIARRVRRWATPPSSVPRQKPRGVTIHSPLVAPYPWNPLSRALDRRLFLPGVMRVASELRDPLVWAFLPTPATVDVVRAMRDRAWAVAYYCVSDFGQVADDPQALRRAEDQLLGEADVVFTNGETLRRRYAGRHAHVSVYPFGADTTSFDPTHAHATLRELAGLRRPIAGYVGALHRHLDRELLGSVMDRAPDVSFVFVGPPQPDTDISSLASRPNATFLGQRPHAELPAFLAAFDVCLIPYALTPYTESVVPTKLFEYLAMGRPVVSTALPELRSMAQLTEVVTLATSSSEFAEAIRRLAVTPGPAAPRRAFAETYSWERLLDGMLTDADSLRRDRGRQ